MSCTIAHQVRLASRTLADGGDCCQATWPFSRSVTGRGRSYRNFWSFEVGLSAAFASATG
ncbi:MAG: hypothetical protein DMF84_06555 [Acidobacteria bacterium]|nr:MAG: hypothetical protein DMF84_06555 [Acidobacteriota bacterium]